MTKKVLFVHEAVELVKHTDDYIVTRPPSPGEWVFQDKSAAMLAVYQAIHQFVEEREYDEDTN